MAGKKSGWVALAGKAAANKGGDGEMASAPLRAEYAHLHRVLRILQLIQEQGGWDAKALASACEVTERTIYRDMKILEGAGIPFSFDTQSRCYRLRADYFMRPVELTLDEALALVALGEQIGKDEQIPFTRAAVRAVAKVRGQLPEKLRRELQAIDHHLSIRLSEAGTADGIEDVYGKVQQAMAEHHCLRCRYEGSGKKSYSDFFIFKPYKLHFDRRAWYVIGHHVAHGAVRSLKLGRFADIQLTDIPFEVPPRFSLESHLGNAWRMIRGAKSYDVELVFDAEFAENIADTNWHKTQKIEWQDDGSIRFQCKVDGLDEIQWWILARGQHCRVVKPAELAQRVKTMALQTAGQYE